MLEKTKVNRPWFRGQVIKLKKNAKYLLYWDCHDNLWDDPQLSLNSLNILVHAASAFYMSKPFEADLYLQACPWAISVNSVKYMNGENIGQYESWA